MSETVRDAVFGNVGTMISFRVSADDAPILAKQFEPQFEPNDLLQMHNRNFIINMVINGEKTPAFSASTLTLPQTQTDNTPRIVEQTRRLYSRPRAEIEAQISDAIRPPENLAPKPKPQAPKSQTLAQKWPVDPGAQAVKNATGLHSTSSAPATPSTATQAPASSQAAPATAGVASVKKKRTRTRKRKPTTQGAGESLPTVVVPPRQSSESGAHPAGEKKLSDGTELRLR